MSAADPRARLMELVAAQGVSLAGLSALLGRNPSYLQQFVRKGGLEDRIRTRRAAAQMRVAHG